MGGVRVTVAVERVGLAIVILEETDVLTEISKRSESVLESVWSLIKALVPQTSMVSVSLTCNIRADGYTLSQEAVRAVVRMEPHLNEVLALKFVSSLSSYSPPKFLLAHYTLLSVVQLRAQGRFQCH